MKELQLLLLCYCILSYSNISAMIGGYDHLDRYDHYSQNRTDQFTQTGRKIFINNQQQTEKSLKIYRLEKAQEEAYAQIARLEEKNKQLKTILCKQKKYGLIGSITLATIASYLTYEVIKNKKESTLFQQK